MNTLVTGSSGYLGAALVSRLRAEGNAVIGLDPVPAPTTSIVASVADRRAVRAALRDHAVRAVVHAGALHKPDVARRPASDFVDVNVHGTLTLLEEATAAGSTVERFVFTSTTSLMISREYRARRDDKRRAPALWITEEMTELAPRNIYGVTKLAAEHLCANHHAATGLPIIVLRTSRFFPEEDDMAATIAQSGPNTKANELLFSRATLEDMVACHLLALEHAPRVGHGLYIVSSRTPFTRADCEELGHAAPRVVARYYPRYEEVYRRLGWTMFESIDRVYVSEKAQRELGFRPKTSFAERLEELERELTSR